MWVDNWLNLLIQLLTSEILSNISHQKLKFLLHLPSNMCQILWKSKLCFEDIKCFRDTKRPSLDSYHAPGSPGSGDIFNTSHHVPATPPATPPSDQEKTTSPNNLPHHLNHPTAAVQAMAYAQACHAMQSFMSRSFPQQNVAEVNLGHFWKFKSDKTKIFSQYLQAEQLGSAVDEDEKLDVGVSDIDLSLPITSTYLRKMKCGSGAGAAVDSVWSSPNNVSR